MKFPLDLTKERIVFDIEQSFDLKISNLEFFPYGESSWLYIGQLQSGEKIVVKVQKEVNALSAFVLDYLAEQKFKWVPRMIFDLKGRTWNRLDGYYFSVHQYIEPKHLLGPNDKPEKAYLYQLGQLLHDLHALPVSESEKINVPFEKFESSFYEYAEECINLVLELDSKDEAVCRAKEMLNKHTKKIALILKNSKRYGRELARSEHTFKLTHGDVHFGNVIDSVDEQLYLIDWDCAMIGLPEYDLMYFDDEQLQAISLGYGTDLIKNKIALGYYRCHLILRAFWFWINKALRAKTAEESKPIWDSFIGIVDDSPYFLRALE